MLPKIANQICVVTFRSQMNMALNNKNGAKRNRTEIKSWAFPNVIVPINAITATHVGVALELPRPT